MFLRVDSAILAFYKFGRSFLCWMLLYRVLRVIGRLINQVALYHPLCKISYHYRLATSIYVIILYIMHFNLVLIYSM
jgi:hypothetical protein